MLSKLAALIVIVVVSVFVGISINAETSTAQEAEPPLASPVEVPLVFSVFKERRISKLKTVNRIRTSRGYYRMDFTHPSYAIAPLQRDDNLSIWTSRIVKARQLPRRCGRGYCTNLGVRLGLAVWNFRNRWESKCIRAHEASYQEWTNPTYDGAWQADDNFESYGREGLRRWGHMTDSKPDWPAWAQDAMAYRGWLLRGFSPWPTYERYCA